MKQSYIIVGFVIVLVLGFSAVTAAQYSSEIYEAQRALQEKGYNPGGVDGIWGNATQNAVKRFQRDVGLPISGQLDKQTKEELGIRHQKRGLRIKQRAVSPSGTEVKGNHWLFVIGIDTYIEWPRLKTAVNDARAVKEVLLSQYHFDKNHLIELYDEQATRKNIIGKLRYLANKVRKDDSLIIFYAGHGHLDSITKSGSWIPVESGTKDASAWISNQGIKNYLKVDAIKAKHILLISDSCFAGDFFRGHRGKLPKVTDEVVKRAYKLASRQAITSGGLEPVVDEGFGNHSVFSHFLIKTQKENQKLFLVPSDMFSNIKAGVAENAEQFPQFGSLKGTGGQQGGELVLFLKQKSRLKDLSAATSKRSDELKRLRQMEIEAREAKKKEEAEIVKREKEVAALDAKITEMKKRLGAVAADTDDSLDAMFAMVQQKEQQQRHIDELKQKQGAEEARRRDEILRLKKEKIFKRIAAIKADIAKYEKIASSPYGKDIKAAAWKSLADKYPEAKEFDEGDSGGLLAVAVPVNVNSIGMEFVCVLPGTFMIGSPANEPGRGYDETQHRVTLTQGFYMQTTEVTQGQWQAVMGINPSKFENCGDDCPVENVSWSDVQQFINKLNQREGSGTYRLPTEAEWEYSARAGSDTAFANGGISKLTCGYDSNLGAMGWYCSNANKKTHPVSQKQPNAWDLYDMHGNVWEWCQDWYGNYHSESATDPTGPSGGSKRVIRGGSWQQYAKLSRSANRLSIDPRYRGNWIGFRLLKNF